MVGYDTHRRLRVDRVSTHSSLIYLCHTQPNRTYSPVDTSAALRIEGKVDN